MSTRPTTGWSIAARDPLVFGDGTRQPALTAVQHAWLPPQVTLAGFVRAGFWAPVTDQTEARHQAGRLLKGVELRGPWLRGPRSDGPLWLPAPLDARRHEVAPGKWQLTTGARLERLCNDEGMHLGKNAGFSSARAVVVKDKLEDDTKTQDLRFPLWRLEHIVAWSLGKPIEAGEIPELHPEAQCPLEREHRVHVGLDDDRGTATPEALFSSSGTRIRDDYAIAIDVTTNDPGLPPARTGTGTLGGRSRPSHVVISGDRHWPGFSAYEHLYAKVLEQRRTRPLLRLQLVTPGCFGGWCPPLAEHRDLAGLTLEAALIPAFSVESGWDMVNRRPRAVRRLVSPGAIYWYSVDVDDPKRLLALCKHFWEHPLPSASFDDPTRAHPRVDGYGQVIPGLYLEES